MSKPSPIIVALDFPTAEQAMALVKQLSPEQVRLKVGLGMFVALGTGFVEQLVDDGFEIFLDLKFHDIPQQVALACSNAAKLGVWMINVHALGGEAMMLAAKQALSAFQSPPLLTAVTILTSHDQAAVSQVGLSQPIDVQVAQLAQLAQQCQLDGVVCSAHEAGQLRRLCGANFTLVTPGIRLTDNSDDDQQRIMTPETALAEGSNYLVIGRPITQAPSPRAVLEQILIDINSGSM